MQVPYENLGIVRPMRLSPDVVARRVDDTVVLVHLGRDQIYSLSVTASRYWELLSERRNPASIVQQLIAEFDIDEASVRDEISRLNEDLLRHRLVVEGADG